MLQETLVRMEDTGITVEDIEFLLLDGTGLQNGKDQRNAWLQMMEAGQALGASTLTVACSDPDMDRFGDHLAQITQDEASGIMPALEPIAYQAVRSIPQAAGVGPPSRLQGGRGCTPLQPLRRHLGGTGSSRGRRSIGPTLRRPSECACNRDGLVAESRSERGVPAKATSISQP